MFALITKKNILILFHCFQPFRVTVHLSR